MEGRRIKINSPRLIPMRQRSDMPPTCSLFTDPDTNHPSHDSWRAWPDNRASSSAPRWPQVSRITSRYWALCAGRDTPLLGREGTRLHRQSSRPQLFPSGQARPPPLHPPGARLRAAWKPLRASYRKDSGIRAYTLISWLTSGISMRQLSYRKVKAAVISGSQVSVELPD
ncbi:uncharacterized protein LOC104846746 isoform X2 [Loxodonta africana]|uniref:uncharacterized protein LOC104846746 isoform X2 n=1 Tax=Loxodonta africana TaxID=9785 RepID=UPI0030CDF090